LKIKKLKFLSSDPTPVGAQPSGHSTPAVFVNSHSGEGRKSEAILFCCWCFFLS